MKCVAVLMKRFKKHCGAIGVVAAKVSCYFITRLLVFDLHFQCSYVENDFILYLRIGRPQSNKSQSNKDYCKRYREKNKDALRKNENVKKLQENTKSTYALKSKNKVYRIIESDPGSTIFSR